jgi:predicted transcriptional regulator
MAENQKTLEKLLVDEQSMNREILHDLLNDYVRIGKQSGDLIPQERFHEMTAKQKTLIVLLAQKARAELDMVESEWMTPGGISTQSGVNKNTVYPTVRELDNEGLIESDDGSYQIPSYSIDRVRDYINEEDTND